MALAIAQQYSYERYFVFIFARWGSFANCGWLYFRWV